MYLHGLGLSREEKNSDPQIIKRLQENTQRRREKFWPADVVDHPLSLLGSLLVNARRLEGQTSVREPFVPLQQPLLTIQKGEKDKRSPISSLLIQYNWILLLPRNCKSSCISCSLGFRPRILPTLQMLRWIWTGATPGFKLTWTWNSSLIFDILVFSYFVRKKFETGLSSDFPGQVMKRPQRNAFLEVYHRDLCEFCRCLLTRSQGCQIVQGSWVHPRWSLKSVGWSSEVGWSLPPPEHRWSPQPPLRKPQQPARGREERPSWLERGRNSKIVFSSAAAYLKLVSPWQRQRYN